MSRFSFNPNDATVGFPVYPKGSYEIELGEPKVRFYEAKEAGKSNRLVLGYPCRIVEGEFKGKPYYLQFDLLNEYGFSNAFGAVMAATGTLPNAENEAIFKEKYGNLDADVSPEDNSIGEFWLLAKGCRVVIDLDISINTTTQKPQQGFPQNIRPVGA